MSSSAVSDHVCYVHCNYCNTILVVSVPESNLCAIVTVRCGHCANLLSVNMGAQLIPHAIPPQEPQGQNTVLARGLQMDSETFSRCDFTSLFDTVNTNYKQDMSPTHPPEKRPRVPSAYNKFIKEEIRRLKSTNPDMSHREAFSAAAKNWAHFPHIHFSLNLDGNKQVKIDDVIAASGGQKSQGYY